MLEPICLAMFLVSLVGPVVLIVRGPTVFDRVVGAGMLGTTTVIVICVLGWIYDRIDMFVDIAIAYSMLNFGGGIVVAKYLDSTRSNQR
jgi:multicomponent Na+:H+ antiporter subunit F